MTGKQLYFIGTISSQTLRGVTERDNVIGPRRHGADGIATGCARFSKAAFTCWRAERTM